MLNKITNTFYWHRFQQETVFPKFSIANVGVNVYYREGIQSLLLSAHKDVIELNQLIGSWRIALLDDGCNLANSC